MHSTFWLVRHGQTDWNVQGRFQGQADPPLNEIGLSEARALAGQLAGQHFDALYSSDLLRARQTAEIIASATGLEIRIEPCLREINQGEWEGMLFEDIQASHPQIKESRKNASLTFRPPGGESLQEVISRVLPVYDEIAIKHPDGKVMVVSHGVTLAIALSKAQKIPLSRVFSLIPPNATPVVVEWQTNHRIPNDEGD
jgi:broad specificity phosphatase PhoE